MYLDNILTGVVNLILFGFVVLARRMIHKEGIRSFFWQSGLQHWRLLLEGFGFGIASFGLYSVIALLLGQAVLTFSGERLLNTLLLTASLAFGFFGVALFEEGLFRGYILPKMLERYSLVAAI